MIATGSCTLRSEPTEPLVWAALRPDTIVEALARPCPILGRDDPDATVTAGNASGQNDGAAVCVVTTPARAAELGLRPWCGWSHGPSPVCRRPPSASARVPASAKALDAAGLTLADIHLIALNEAFAAQAPCRDARVELAPADFDRLNVNGAGISLGHPVGATGGRIAATAPRARCAGSSVIGSAGSSCGSRSRHAPPS